MLVVDGDGIATRNGSGNQQTGRAGIHQPRAIASDRAQGRVKLARRENLDDRRASGVKPEGANRDVKFF